jgi:hypothetical protein
LNRQNGPAQGGILIGIGGERFGKLEIPVKVQLGLTFSGKSYWVSDTRVYFFTPPGIGIVSTIILSIVRLRVIAEGQDGTPIPFYFDHPNIYRLILSNAPTDARRAQITVVGLNYGTVDYSPETKLGDSPYMFSTWTSDTSVSTRVPSGLGRALTTWEAVASQVGFADDILSYNEPVLSGIIPVNQPIKSAHSSSSPISGLDFAVYDTTMNFRLESTAAERTEWLSDSSIICRIPTGFRATREISITVSVLTGTHTEAFSFNDAVLISLQGTTNSARQGGLELAGSRISYFSDLSIAIKVGISACESSTWLSDTTVTCISQIGDHRSIFLVLTTAERSCSLSQQFTFDSNVLSQSGITNSPVKSSRTVAALMLVISELQDADGNWFNVTYRITGARFGLHDSSNVERSGMTSAESTVWSSDSSLFAGPSDGTFSSRTFIVTSASVQAGTVSLGLSFDRPIVSSAFSTNAPRSGQVISFLAGSGMGTSHYSAGIRVGGCILGFCLHGTVPRTPCTHTAWFSTSAVVCKIPMGISDGVALSMTSGIQIGSISSVFSYDEWPLLNALNNSNSPSRYGKVFLQGLNLGNQYLSPFARIGFSECELSLWVSTSAVRCGVASGLDINMPATLTLGLNQSIWVQASICGAFSYNAPELSSIKFPNSPLFIARSITVQGIGFSWRDSSLRVKSYFTLSSVSQWKSDTSLLSLKAFGVGASLSVILTSIVRTIGTGTHIFTHDPAVLYMNAYANVPPQETLILLAGTNLGYAFLSSRSKFGETAVHNTVWISDTQCKALMSGISTGSLRASLTLGLITGTSTNAISFDHALLLRCNGSISVSCNTTNEFKETSSTLCFGSAGNVPVLGNLIVLEGSFPWTDYSPSSRVKFTSAQVSTWTSDSVISCRLSGGVGNNLFGSVTISEKTSSLSDLLTYDLATSSSLQIANSPIQLQRLWNVTATKTLLDPLSEPAILLSDGPSLLMTFIRGQNYGNTDMSILAFSIGGTGCELTGWISTSGIYCRRSVGVSSTKFSVCSVAQRFETLTELFSFDSPLIDPRSLSRSNSPAAAAIVIAFGSLLECSPGYYFNQTYAGMQCVPCMPGNICKGNNKAMQCPSGSWSSSILSTTCSACPIGTYQDVVGATVCKNCPLQGQNTSLRGATSITNCSCPFSRIPMSSWFLSRGICPQNISNVTVNSSNATISTISFPITTSISTLGELNAMASVNISAPMVILPVSGGLGRTDFSQTRFFILHFQFLIVVNIAFAFLVRSMKG